MHRYIIFFFALAASMSSLSAQVVGVAFKEYTFGTTYMSARLEVTDTTTQAQRDARKFSFSWTARLVKDYGTGTNGAVTDVQFSAMTTANNGAFYSYSTLASRSNNSSYDQTYSGSYTAPNSYVVGTEYVDIKLKASCISSSTQSTVFVMRISLTGDVPQSIALNLQSSDNFPREDGAHPRGTTFVIKATGGHNDYVWDLRPAPGYSQSGGGLIINSTTDEAIAYVFGLGVYEIACYNEGGNGYEQSPEEVYTVTTYSVYRSRIPISNSSDHNLIFRFYQGSTLLKEVTLGPGQSQVVEVVSESPYPISVRQVDPEISDDGVIWTYIEETPTEIDETEIHVVEPQDDLEPPEAPPIVAQAPSTSPPPANNSTNVWTSISTGNKDEGVTAKTYAEGVNKISGLVLGGGGETPFSFDSEPAEGAEIDFDGDALISAVEGMLPRAADLPASIGKTSAFSVAVPFPYIGTKNFVMDWAAIPSAATNAFRLMMLACEGIVWFFFSVRVIKGAFAS